MIMGAWCYHEETETAHDMFPVRKHREMTPGAQLDFAFTVSLEPQTN